MLSWVWVLFLKVSLVIKYKDSVFCISSSVVVATASSLQQYSRNVCGASVCLDKGVTSVLSPLRHKEHRLWGLLSTFDDEHHASVSVISLQIQIFLLLIISLPSQP